jgi:K+-transporting ATPase KdpF subunit
MPASGCERAMILDYILGGVTTVLITAYLIYALIRPEKF